LARDLAPIALVGLIPNVLVVNPGVPASNVGELVALAKSKPDSITFSSPGAGTAGHLAAELFNLKAGTKLVVVQYQGGSPHAVADLVTGRTSAMFAVASTMVPQVKAGKLKALAVAQAKRAGIMPDVPTMVEAGMPGFDAPIWVGLLAPAGTPADIIKKLSGAVNEALKSEEVLGPMKAQGFDPMGGTPEELARYIEADIEKWNAVTAAAGIKK
jgi:tripartite-type tricarboxylate transporter receptor subunit TctC